MKFLCLMALFGWLSAGCSVSNRSDEYACVNLEDCPQGRTCVSGWCVVSSDPQPVIDAAVGSLPDGAPAPPDAGPCPDECTACLTGGICTIDCSNPANCVADIVCPAGMVCNILCTGSDSCAQAINCTDASACTVLCNGNTSCQGPITCGGGICRVECIGEGSCGGGIDCQDSCACDTSCIGLDSCAAAPLCPRDAQCTDGNECDSTASGPCSRC